MAKILVLSGSHQVGKTSVIEKLQENKKSEFVIFNELNTGLNKIGYLLNNKSDFFEDTMFSQKTAFDLGYDLINFYLKDKSDRIVILDRSCIDTYIYTDYFLSTQENKILKKYSSLLNEMKIKSAEIAEKVPHILVMPIKEVNQFIGKMDQKSQQDIWDNMQIFFKKVNTPSNFPQFLREDTIDNRVKNIIKIINEYI